MYLLNAIAQIFINTFGITQPTHQARRRASWFIFCLLLGVLALIGGVVAVGLGVMGGRLSGR